MSDIAEKYAGVVVKSAPYQNRWSSPYKAKRVQRRRWRGTCGFSGDEGEFFDNEEDEEEEEKEEGEEEEM